MLKNTVKVILNIEYVFERSLSKYNLFSNFFMNAISVYDRNVGKPIMYCLNRYSVYKKKLENNLNQDKSLLKTDSYVD